MYCAFCGAEMKASERFCAQCGKRALSLAPMDEPADETDLEAVPAHELAEENENVEQEDFLTQSKRQLFGGKAQVASELTERQTTEQRVELFREQLLQFLSTAAPSKWRIGQRISITQLAAAAQQLSIQQDDILALFDCSTLGNMKSGIVIGLKGLYWKNPAVATGRPSYLSWERVIELLPSSKIQPKQLYLNNIHSIQPKQSKQWLTQFKKLLQGIADIVQQHHQAYLDVVEQRYPIVMPQPSTWQKIWSGVSHFNKALLLLALLLSGMLLTLYWSEPEPPRAVAAEPTPLHITEYTLKEGLVCPAALVKLIGINSKYLEYRGQWLDAHYFQYRDNTGVSKFKCRLKGDQVMWGNADGRWRDKDYDAKVTFHQVSAIQVVIREKSPQGRESVQVFLAY